MAAAKSWPTPVYAPTFSMLDTARGWRANCTAFGISTALQIALGLVLIWFGVMQPALHPSQRSAMLVYIPLVAAPSRGVHTPAPLRPAPLRVAAITRPPLIRPVVPPVVKLPTPLHVVPVSVHSPVVVAPLMPVAKPRPTVHLDAFDSAAVATVRRLAPAVQTGGFGVPRGVSGTTRTAGNTPQLGTFELPAGAGYGNGSGGAHGVRGVVASAGFGNGEAGRGRRAGPGDVHASGFGEVANAPVAPAHHAVDAMANASPVEILAKPTPRYTDEARRLHLEGDVVLRVVFGADGRVRTQGILRGLGHGLDEAALQAAEQIKFVPARRAGAAIDTPALVHIAFQIAG